MAELSREAVMSRLTRVFRTVFDDDEIVLRPETSPADIEEWDSLNHIRIVLACEQVFGVELDARDITSMRNVGDFVNHLLAVAAA
jgi:acyl carrier protein